MANPSPSKSFGRLKPAEWIARREESITKIGEALAEREMTVDDVAERFNLPRDTAYGHLVYMEGLGLAHRTGRKVAQRVIWATGEMPEELRKAVTPPPPRTVVNVHRDFLVAALFGPAGRAA